MTGLTISDSELEDILASVAGDAPVVPPKKEEPPVAAPEPAKAEDDIGALIDALDGPTGEEVAATEGEAESVEDVVATLDAETKGKIVSGEIMTDDATEAAVLEAAAKAEPPTAPAPEPEGEVSTAIEPEVKETETPAPSGEKKVVGVTYFIDPARLARDVSISLTNLDDALMTHASNFVHYAVQASNARRQYERMKAAFEILESKLDNKWRVALKEENPKTTEAQIRAAVVGDKEWSQANVRMIEARTIYELAQDAKEAFTMRRDTLLQLAKDAREERLGQLRVTQEVDARGRVDEMLRGKGATA
jgi:hypothetical protein